MDIGYVFPLAAHYIPHTVRRFLSTQKNKDVTFNFHQSHTGEMIHGLKNEKYDVIFGSYVEDEPDIQFVPILNQEMIIITPVGHPLSKKEQVSIHDLEHYPLIGYDRTSGLGRFTSRTYTSYTLHPNIICESPDENAIASLVAEDFGIALVADVAILDHFKLEKLHLSDVTLHHTVYLAYLRGHYQVPAVRNFISFIKKKELLCEVSSLLPTIYSLIFFQDALGFSYIPRLFTYSANFCTSGGWYFSFPCAI